MSDISPIRPIHTIVQDSNDPGYVNRLMVGTPTTGLVRIEWVSARYGQMIPVNWSMVTLTQFMSSYIPLRYQVADAQNLIVKECIEKDFEWLLLIEHDVVLPPDCFMRFNEYMRAGSHPLVSGLYYTRSRPSEPLIFRGMGTGAFVDWKLGDLVWCDGVPTGCLLIHSALLRAVWAESEEYQLGNIKTRRVFDTPRAMWVDPQTGYVNTTAGTSDLNLCHRIIKGGFLAKAGWAEFQEKEFPFIVDTNILCGHIDQNGTMYP